jgi:hypothetical protein
MKLLIVRYFTYKNYGNIWESSGISLQSYSRILNFSDNVIIADHSYRQKPDLYSWSSFKTITYEKSYSVNHYETVCVDNSTGIAIGNITADERNLIDKLVLNENIPLDTDLPSVKNKFILYNHDNGLYSCLKLISIRPETVLQNLLNFLLPESSKVKIDCNSMEFSLMAECLKHGFSIDSDSIALTDGKMMFSCHFYKNSKEIFGNLVFDKAVDHKFNCESIPVIF